MRQIPTIQTHGDKYIKWEDEVTTHIQDILEAARGDAQGIIEANDFAMNKAWAANWSAKRTAQEICNNNF